MIKRGGSRANALLMEIILVVLFFALASTVCLKLFVAGRIQTENAGRMNLAVRSAQNYAELIYDADDPQAMLIGAGFSRDGAVYTLDVQQGLTVEITWADTGEQSGRKDASVLVKDGEDVLLTLPVSRYSTGEGEA